MNSCIIIPARYASTRFPGKMLTSIAGKPLIQHVWERASQSAIKDVYVAVDDEKVKQAVESFAGTAVMTPPTLPSGTDRVAFVSQQLDVDVIINVQGDEPLIDPQAINQLLCAFDDPAVHMATLVTPMDAEVDNPNVVKAVLDTNGDALYFSRAPIPFNRDNSEVTYYQHIGMYGYRKDFLQQIVQLPVSTLESIEKLEQLRVLENGHKIRCLVTAYKSIGVDAPEDVAKVEALL